MPKFIQDELFERLINHVEKEIVEFKVNNVEPKMIGERISGLSNSACLEGVPHAYLIYGVSDAGKVVGTTFDPYAQKIGNENLINWLANRMDPKLDLRYIEHKHDLSGCRVVIVEVPAAKTQPSRFDREAYIRIGSANRRLIDFPNQERRIWLNAEKYAFESEAAASDLAVDDVLSLIDYGAYFELFQLSPSFDKDGIVERLCAEGFVRFDGSRYAVTNLGAILLARDLTKFERLDRKRTRVIVYKGNNRVETKKEHIGTKGYAIGFDKLISHINDQLPANEEIGKAFRREVKVYPELAVRELVANAIIHQDFAITGAGPLVEIFDDRIEITNPGVALIDPLRFIDHAPQSRNEKLASAMRRINICEERGSGVDKVVKLSELFQLPAPDFYQGDNYLRATLYAPKALRDMDKKDRVRACYQHCCLKWVSSDVMTNQSLRERFKIDDKNYAIASRIIADTIDAILVKVADAENRSNRHARYVPIWS